jgi:16S rRNA (adenine1518-N6/adenine1519-N6)-dimethyltransferase
MVKPKKKLGQHFLKDNNIAARIVTSFSGEGCDSVLEIGPGTGILTGALLERNFSDFQVIEIDDESVQYLRSNYGVKINIIAGDFLAFDLRAHFKGTLGIIGNLPYNISSQIFFKIIQYRDIIPEVCCMVQKEVAQRICAKPGSRIYGILSVLVQAYYSADYLFSVSGAMFYPPPKVESGVIRLLRNQLKSIDCNEELFVKVVKACFNQRRKKLRNSVKAAFDLSEYDFVESDLRPEQLSTDQFIGLTNWIDAKRRHSE